MAETASLRNLAATLVDLAGWAGDSPFPVTSLAPLWQPSSRPPDAVGSGEGALAELFPNETLDGREPDPSRRPWRLAALKQGGWSFIRREGEVHEELYHLRDDPREQHDLAAAPGSWDRVQQLRQTLGGLTAGPLTLDRFPP